MYLAHPTILIREVLQNNAYDSSRVSEELVGEYAKGFRSPGGRSALITTARQLMDVDWSKVTPRYQSLDVPALIIWCRNDPFMPLSHARRFHEDLPHSELTLLQHCGHSPQEEQPALVVAVIRKFLAR